jgi:hypothetical protein
MPGEKCIEPVAGMLRGAGAGAPVAPEIFAYALPAI